MQGVWIKVYPTLVAPNWTVITNMTLEFYLCWRVTYFLTNDPLFIIIFATGERASGSLKSVVKIALFQVWALTLIRPSTIIPIARERIWMAPRRSLTFFFRVLRIFKQKWKSDLHLQGHVTPCLCMSARKSLIFVICVQNIWKCHFS